MPPAVKIARPTGINRAHSTFSRKENGALRNERKCSCGPINYLYQFSRVNSVVIQDTTE
jgi:hypothetical protein